MNWLRNSITVHINNNNNNNTIINNKHGRLQDFILLFNPYPANVENMVSS